MGAALVKNLHIIILLMMVYNLFSSYEEKEDKILKITQARPSIKSEIDKLKEKIEVAKSYEKNLDQVKKRVEEVKLQIVSTQKQLPTSTDDTKILDEFNIEAKNLNIKEIYLSPGPEEEKGFYFSKNYEFKGVGTWLQFLVFFESLMKKERLYNVKTFTLNRSNVKTRGRFQFLTGESILEAFRYNPNYKSPEEIKREEEEAKKEELRKAQEARRKRARK